MIYIGIHYALLILVTRKSPSANDAQTRLPQQLAELSGNQEVT